MSEDWTCRDCGRAGDDCSLKAIFSLEDTYYVCIGGWASECKDKIIKRLSDEIKQLESAALSQDAFYGRAIRTYKKERKLNSDALQCLERYLTEQDEQFIMDAIGILKGE